MLSPAQARAETFSLSLPELGLPKGGGTTSLNLAQFSKFCNDKFHFRAKANQLRDFRKKPQISMATLFLFLVGSLALRKKSLHQIDLFARMKGVRRWLGSDRYMVASDATYWRILPRISRIQVREHLQQAYRLLRNQGHSTVELPGGRRIRAAAVDGSVLSGRYASAVEVLGRHPVVLDLEPCEGRGKELPTSERVLRRVFDRHGKGFVDVVLGDGLYITEKMLRLCREDLQTHLLVKTAELDSLAVQVIRELAQGGLASRPSRRNAQCWVIGELIRVLQDGGSKRRTALSCPPQRCRTVRDAQFPKSVCGLQRLLGAPGNGLAL